jgi:acyl-CoA reductase-like NAD-dependent aldehyde dehydrogenase
VAAASLSPSQLAAIVARSRSAQEHWKLRSFEDRAKALTRAAKEMLRRRHEVIALAHEEMGKVAAEGIFNEALGPLDTVSGWVKLVRRETERRNVRLNPLSFPKKRAYVDLLPRGVVGVIAPWNYPVAGLYRSLIPALLTGNGVVLKPSEYTPKTSGWLAQMLANELPEGLISVVPGDGRAGAALINAGIDACIFTGSVRTGQSVRVACAERGIPCSVEMGGKDAAIVLGDCDLEKTTAGLTHWALSNAGQACGAIEILYVDQSIADELLSRLTRAWEQLRPEEDIAPLANQRQLDVVRTQVEDAKARGAKVLTGGSAGAGLYYPPTLLDHCSDQMSVIKEETFGPVLAVIRVNGAGDAVRRVNASRYGLGASLWTSDIARGERLAEKLDVGVVTINNHAFSGAIPELPWSGVRDTGFGIANGPESLHTFVRPRATIVDESKGAEVFFLPYDKSLVELGHLLADAQVGKILGAWKLPFLLKKRADKLKKFFSGR